MKKEIIEYVKSLDLFKRSFDISYSGKYLDVFDWVINLGFVGIRKWVDADTKHFYRVLN